MTTATGSSPFKLRRDFKDITGLKHNDLRVIGVVGRKRYPSGQSKILFSVFCLGCGDMYAMSQQRVFNAKGCPKCARPAGYQSLKLPDGRTIKGIADEAGLKLDTVYHRYVRGWPPEKLGEKLKKR